jgi:hypothetical protein
MDRNCSTYEEKKVAYRILMEIPEGKRPLGKPRHRWEDKIKIGLRTRLMWLSKEEWRALADTVMNPRVPQKFGNSGLVGRLTASQEGLSSI